MQRRTFIKHTGAAGIIFLARPEQILARREEGNLTLDQGFKNPPASAHPHAYWCWMNGNVTREGITLDLEAMKRIGVAGVFNFDVGTGIPKGPVEYLGEEWLELKKHTIKECDRLGIEFVMHNCPGWSSSGGPWITPELSMQQLTWSEAYVSGGKEIDLQLPKPAQRLNYYRDVAVVAFPSLEGEELLQSVKISSREGLIDREKLYGNSEDGAVVYSAPNNQPAWLQFEFDAPYEGKQISFFISAIPPEGGVGKPIDFGERTSIVLESSMDGKQFKKVTVINTGLDTELFIGYKYIVFDIPTTRAKYFRLTSTGTRKYKQVQFSGITRLRNWMEKSNLRGRSDAYVEERSTIQSNNDQIIPKGSIIDADSVIDVTTFTNNEGRLKWNAPSGNWTILRIGHTAMGTLNKAAPDTGLGLECDKFNADAITFHFKKMMERILPVMDAVKNKMGLTIDSYEAGGQNWTAGFEERFRERAGYDIAQYLPALAGGRILKSVELTERFLWDVRRIQANLMAENYYGRFTELCHEHNLTSSIEPYESGPMEEMQVGSKGDILLGEFWSAFSFITPVKSTARRTTKLAATIAHVNGQQIVAAEAFTAEPEAARWQEYPFYLKAVGDKAFCIGINRFVIHRFAHQPHPSAMPGMSMGPWGIHFDRTNTWWNPAKSWINYLARCQYLLQQGRFVADLLYFSGDDANMYTTVEAEKLLPQPIPGFDYDLANADVIMNHLRVSKEGIELESGMRYRIFVLQQFKAIPFELLQKIYQLVQEGMILIGRKPERSTGIIKNSASDLEFSKLCDLLWGNDDIIDRKVGKGRVFWGKPLESILQTLDIKPDFQYSSRSGDAPIIYTHRKLENGDLYFLSNQRRTYEEIVCTFRVKNKQPELWDPNTGTRTKLSIYEIVDESIRLPIQMEPYGSSFLVFRENINRKSYDTIKRDGNSILTTRNFPKTEGTQQSASSFTILFWAKPEINVLLNPVFVMGSISQPWTEYYAIYPRSGKQLFGEGHACVGVTVGRNGIAVWEHSDVQPEFVLPVKLSISGWAHVAVVYEDNVPSVYVNNKLIATGIKSKYTVHAVIHPMPITEGASYYNGDMTQPQVFNHTKEFEPQVRKNITSPDSPFSIEFTGTENPALLIKKDGNYSLENNEHSGSVVNVSKLPKPIELVGAWNVYFPSGLGAPPHVVLQELNSLHLHNDIRVKYFSGTATYKKSFVVPKSVLGSGLRWYLDLGSVEVLAAVKLNGKNLGDFWKRPFRVDVTAALKEGENLLEVQVTNQWVNRLVGDEQLPDPDKFTPGAGSSGLESATKGNIVALPDWYKQNKPKPQNGRVTFTTWKHFTKDSPLLESGLIGPVKIEPAVVHYL